MKNEIFKKPFILYFFMTLENEKILSFLRENSRMPFLKIAKELNVSEGTIRNRVNELLSSGVIKKFTIKTTQDKTAIIMIKVSTKTNLKIIIKKLKKLGFE
jgi:DNA-binding Lrp family transcriptional regulator